MLLTIAALTLTSGCVSAVSSGAGCNAYYEHSRGLVGDDAPATPDGVKRRVLVLDSAMDKACK